MQRVFTWGSTINVYIYIIMYCTVYKFNISTYECFQRSVNTARGGSLQAPFTQTQALTTFSTEDAEGVNRTHSSLEQLSSTPHWQCELANYPAVYMLHWVQSLGILIMHTIRRGSLPEVALCLHAHMYCTVYKLNHVTCGGSLPEAALCSHAHMYCTVYKFNLVVPSQQSWFMNDYIFMT